MKFGIGMFPTDFSIGAVALGRAAEERGFESLWFPEHIHIPVSRVTPFPSGGKMPADYSHSLDPFVAFAAVAATTSRLRLGTGICLVVERDPIVLAKEVATLDQLCDGRVLLGVGAGWNLEEMQNHGTEPKRRWSLLRERILAMKQIWTQEEAEFHGEFVDFGPIWQWPKPVQRPYVPVLIGGEGPTVLRRVVQYGDGWMPNAHGGPMELEGRMAELRSLASDAGRDPPPVTVWSPPRDPRLIEQYEELGVERCIFGLAAAPAESILPRLDHYAELAHRFA
jgi:probable F420-dependent oxidoreductase